MKKIIWWKIICVLKKSTSPNQGIMSQLLISEESTKNFQKLLLPISNQTPNKIQVASKNKKNSSSGRLKRPKIPIGETPALYLWRNNLTKVPSLLQPKINENYCRNLLSGSLSSEGTILFLEWVIGRAKKVRHSIFGISYGK